MLSFQKKQHRMSNVWHIFRPTLANIYAQGSMYTGETTWWGLPGTGRQEPLSLGCPRQNCATNRQIFSTPSFSSLSHFEGTRTGCKDLLPYKSSQKCFLSLSFQVTSYTLFPFSELSNTPSTCPFNIAHRVLSLHTVHYPH